MQSYYLKLLNMCKFVHDRKTFLLNIPNFEKIMDMD